jgi:hypothetical protein
MSHTRVLIYETAANDGMTLADLAELVQDARQLLHAAPDSNYPLRTVRPVVTVQQPRGSQLRPGTIRRLKVTL